MMTYALTRYKSYQEYLEDESLSAEANYRLLSTGELIEVASEDDLNRRIALRLLLLLAQIEGGIYAEHICNGNKELQVNPVGDRRVNRKPDVMVLHPEHLEVARQAVLLEMVPPLFVAEVVSPGGENSENYQRDYVWKRQQYEDLGIPEYWIIDPHRETVTALALVEGSYKGTVCTGDDLIKSKVFPKLAVVTKRLFQG
ncbi:MAG: Uma2 family endonuclease [Cyanobacteria bacterium J06621_3]